MTCKYKQTTSIFNKTVRNDIKINKWYSVKASFKHKWSLENFIKPKSYIVKERQHHSIHSKKRSICKTLHQMKEQNGKAMEKQKFPENDSSLASYSTEKHG